MAGHGHPVVTAGPDAIDTEFVCIVRPMTRATVPDGKHGLKSAER